MKQLTAAGMNWGPPVPDDFDRLVEKVMEVVRQYGLREKEVRKIMARLEAVKDNPEVDWEKIEEEMLAGMAKMGMTK